MNNISHHTIPTLTCRRVKRSVVQTELCPLCGKRHTHGIAGLEDGSRTHRCAHCDRSTPPKWVRQMGDVFLESWRDQVAKGYHLQLVD